jgi:Ca2+-dependent lipid-binding protein
MVNIYQSLSCNYFFAGKSDPYVIFKISKNQTAKSKVINNTLNPTWNEKLMLNCGVGDNVNIEVYDEDTVGSDDLL